MAHTIVLARHGETDWNAEHKIQGHQGPELNARGRAQSIELADQLRQAGLQIIHVISSDLPRAIQTRDLVGAHLGLSSRVLKADSRLRECGFGELEGMTRAAILADPKYGAGWQPHLNDYNFDYDFRPLGGECRADVVARQWAVVDELWENEQVLLALLIGHGRSLNNLFKRFWPSQAMIMKTGEYRVITLPRR